MTTDPFTPERFAPQIGSSTHALQPGTDRARTAQAMATAEPGDNIDPPWWPERLAALARLASWSQGGPLPECPAELFLEVSNVCDLKCAMCPTFSGLSPSRLFSIKEQERGFIDLDRLWPSLVPLLPQVISVHCFGYGEPTLHPDFATLIKRLGEYRVLIDFFTNGMHLDEALCALLVEHWVFSVTVSVSGTTAKEYESIYLGGGFERLLAGIQRLAAGKKAAGRPYPRLEVNTIAFEHQVRELPDFVDLMATAGVEVIHLKALQTFETTKELAGHRAIFRPWIDGPILEEAERRARAHGVILSTDQYRQTAVADETAWRTARGDVSATLTLAELPEAARRLIPHQPPPGYRTGSLLNTWQLEGESLEQALAFGPYQGTEPFYCLEPFKTLYVRRSGHTKPCCFAYEGGPSLGNLHEANARAIWQGLPFRAIRSGISEQHYPQALCAHCLKHGYGPHQHSIPDQLAQYRAWLEAAWGERLLPELPEATLSNRQIIERWRANDPETSARLLAEVRRLGPDTPSELIEGHLDGLIRGDLHGWIWAPRYPHLRLWVELRLDDQPWQRLRADGLREDLVQAGKGDGRYAFHLTVAQLPKAQSLAVYLADTQWLLGRIRLAETDPEAPLADLPEPSTPSPWLIDYRPGIHEQEILGYFARYLPERPPPRPPSLRECPELVIVIAFTNRSGSNLLAESLAASGLINRAEELFDSQRLIEICETRGIQDLPGYLAHLRTELGPRFAVKLSWDQLFFLWRVGVIPNYWPRVRFIWIERQDLLAQAMSYLVAERTGCWSGPYPEKHLKRVLAELTPEDLIARLETITFAQGQFNNLFTLYGIKPVRVIYEQLAQDPESEAQRVFRELDLIPEGWIWRWNREALISRPQRTLEMTARLQALVAAIRGIETKP